ncbi:MAG: hypothetical protein DMF70_10130, partial [Acidobacteria bacterium]
TALGNSGHGVEVYTAASGNVIGVPAGQPGPKPNRDAGSGAKAIAAQKQLAGLARRAVTNRSGQATRKLTPLVNNGGANIIANNGGDGVRVSSSGDINNLISQNSIFANTGLGINLGIDGVTPNDSGDSDTGPNNLQNFPVIQVAAMDTQTISGTLDSSVNGPFTIEFFNNGPGGCDGSGNGEGKTFIGSAPTSGGPFTSSQLPLGSFVTGDVITATATDANGNTSEFSVCFTATATASTPSFSIDDVTHNEGNGGPGTTSYTFTITKTGSGAASVDYATVDGTATAPSDYTAIPTTTLNFLSADTTQQVTVFVNGDTAFEGDETFTVHLSNGVGATISDADGLGTITNDDTCASFATVYVDDSWAGTQPGSDPDGPGPATSFGCDSFATIQGGVTAVTAGGTVIVYDGTYTENVTISKPVVLKGAQFGVDARGRVAAESVVSPATASSATFLLNTNTTTTVIDGFTFTGGTSLGVIQTQSGSDFSNLKISNNRFSGYSQAAVFMNRGGSDITIDKNVMDGSNITGSGQA